MKKIIALNWKDTFTREDTIHLEEAKKHLEITENVVHILPDFEWIIFPGDGLIGQLQTSIFLGSQSLHVNNPPYCLIGHISKRLNGITNLYIQNELTQLKENNVTPVLCIGPVQKTDTMETVIDEQLKVLDAVWENDWAIIIAYEPVFAVGSGQSMTLEDVSIMYDVLSQALQKYTRKYIIYGGSVNDTNIAQIIQITDGVIVGSASQKSETLLALSIALGQESNSL